MTCPRGSWFWQDDDDTWVPYPPDITDILEKAFSIEDRSLKTVEVSKKPLRVVTQFSDGTYKQIRKTKHGNAGGREVVRGFPSASLIHQSHNSDGNKGGTKDE